MNKVYKQALFFTGENGSYYGDRFAKYSDIGLAYKYNEIVQRDYYNSLAIF